MNNQEEAITQIIEKVSGVSRELIRSKSRVKRIHIPRSILGYMLRQDVGCTYKRAGELVGRDHASVIKYNKDHEGNFRYYQDYKILYREVQSRYISEYKGVKFSIIQKQIKDLQEQLNKIAGQTQEY
jgi:hypothetical protein|tara:strand:+ start:1909 stop:2289 length:381 start_codon:yes stop_codon:yes gene_type:complete